MKECQIEVGAQSARARAIGKLIPVGNLRKKRLPSTHCGMRHMALACNRAGGTSRSDFSEDFNVHTALLTVSLPAAILSLINNRPSSFEGVVENARVAKNTQNLRHR
jgi:hypothetical protein